MKKILFGLFIIVFVAASCKKDDTPANVTPTVQNLTGSYKISQITMKSGTSAEVPVTDDLLDACEKDDIHKLNSNLSYEIVDAGTKCDPENTYTGDWSLTNSTTIVIDGDSGTIRKFDGKNLEITYDYLGATAIVYYVKQ